MTKIGDWVYYTDENNENYIGQVIGFEMDHKIRIYFYPGYSGPGRVKIMNPEDLRFPTLKELTDPYYTEEEEIEVAESKPFKDGYELAQVLGQVFVLKPGTNPGSVLALAEFFAKAMSFGAFQDGMQFVKGFSYGFGSNHPKEIESGE